MATRHRIALIHATPIAVDPIADALKRLWPDVEAVNLLEDSLSPDLDRAGALTDELSERIFQLGKYARSIGSEGILYTCSSFGSAIERTAAALDVPVLKPNEAMFESAAASGGRVAMLYTFPPSRASMEEEFRIEADRLGSSAKLDAILVDDAIAAVRRGDADRHNQLVAEAAKALGTSEYDAIVLAHFSTARALEAVRQVTSLPVLTSPDAAVAKLKSLISG